MARSPFAIVTIAASYSVARPSLVSSSFVASCSTPYRAALPRFAITASGVLLVGRNSSRHVLCWALPIPKPVLLPPSTRFLTRHPLRKWPQPHPLAVRIVTWANCLKFACCRPNARCLHDHEITTRSRPSQQFVPCRQPSLNPAVCYFSVSNCLSQPTGTALSCKPKVLLLFLPSPLPETYPP